MNFLEAKLWRRGSSPGYAGLTTAAASSFMRASTEEAATAAL
jgi:hypothetical protein